MCLPRSYLGSSSSVRDLHVFVDSSKKASGAWVCVVNDSASAFVMSKSRVAPLKILGRVNEQPTIPLLELMAASLGVDMATSISRVFSANGVKVRITFWGDNQAVLYQIHQEEQHKDKIVENRTKKIKLFNEASGAKWRYVPADSNPADLLTRRISLEQFQSSNLWKFGPSWLTNPEEWPVWNMENQKSVAV